MKLDKTDQFRQIQPGVGSEAKTDVAQTKPSSAEQRAKLGNAPVLGPGGPPVGHVSSGGSNVTARSGENSQLQARTLAAENKNWHGFSSDPDALSQLLSKEILDVQSFVSDLKDAFSFFGGARVRPEDDHFAEGKIWGEAVLLTNVAAKAPQVVALASESGLFSKEAVDAASAVALGCAVGCSGSAAVSQSLSELGGAANSDNLRTALVEACCETTKPEDMELLMTLTRTGAGPGMMEAVPIGYLDARQKLMRLVPELGEALQGQLSTQGSRIELPFEQAPNPYIEKMREFVHFLPRRLALTEQANGFVVFPGGVGTLNELFEVVRYGRPTVLCSTEFYAGMLDELTKAWKERDLVDPAIFANLKVVDGPEEGLPHLLARAKASPPAEEPSVERAQELASDLQRGLKTLMDLPSAVTFIGGSRLKADDAEVEVGKEIAARLTRSNVPLRTGGDGVILEAVSDGARSVRPDAKIQGLLLNEGHRDHSEIRERLDVCEVVGSSAAHKVLMYENTDAIVALPGGVGTFDEIFELVTLMQCEKIPMRPLVLVGRDFWQPFLDEMARVMLDKDSDLPEDQKLKTISDEDMHMFQVVDDAAEAARIIRVHRAKIQADASASKQ